MTSNSNVQPKKRPKKPVGSPWSCECGQNPHYLLFCVRCSQGQKKPQTGPNIHLAVNWSENGLHDRTALSVHLKRKAPAELSEALLRKA